jgi:hypothetical protein
MNTKIIMTVCAGVLGITGLVFSFLPQELAIFMGWPDSQPIVLQMIGALYFAFAITNWTAKANIIGGIYGKPIALGNFTHFSIGTLALGNWIIQNPVIKSTIALTGLYAIFAIAFGYILFIHPNLKIKDRNSH